MIKVALCVLLAACASPLAAQIVTIDGLAGATLPSITPTLTVRAGGFGNSRPFVVRLFVATSPTFESGVLVDSIFVMTDSMRVVQITRPLPSEGTVHFKARVETPDGTFAESPHIGPRTVPAWLTLISPNSSAGDIVGDRRPVFTWKSASVTPLLGRWRYDFEVTNVNAGGAELGIAGITDTTFRAGTELQTNTSYAWNVRASLANGSSITVKSAGTFLVQDQALPSRTLLYQNFPNPFPQPYAFSTCIWFDVAEPGARISLDVTDLRGNIIRTLIPGNDGQRDFLPGRYGQGAVGAGTNCDNRFVWDGTGSDGRTVAAGVYLLRFQAGRGAPTFRRMLFLGR